MSAQAVVEVPQADSRALDRNSAMKAQLLSSEGARPPTQQCQALFFGDCVAKEALAILDSQLVPVTCSRMRRCASETDGISKHAHLVTELQFILLAMLGMQQDLSPGRCRLPSLGQ